jgi:3-oxoacyl-[acyl-carrier protein] reductase
MNRSVSAGKTLEGKIALVTGSSRGIGAAIARRFAAEGARVALHGRDSAALTEVQSRIRADGAAATCVTGDVTKFEEIERIRDEVERRLGEIDVLVVNAGGSFQTPGPFEELTEEGWRATVDGNLTSTFLTIKSVLPAMKRRCSGNIITVSSAAARHAHPHAPVSYAAAKAGIQMLTQHLAAQVGPFGIRVNCLAPETILTERNVARIPDAQKSSMIDMHPLKRLGTPDDVSSAALFLASDQSAWITGLILDVSGGAVMA